MRVVAGAARGRQLRSPRGRAIRPTSDRAREGIFNSLTSITDLEGSTVLDLFAGTGALGIESLSRGAARATFVDDDRSALALIERNLALTGLSGGTVVRADAVQFLRNGPHVDIAFADPPYAFDDWPSLLSRLRAGVAVLESDRPVDVGDEWRVLRTKRYGGTVVTLAELPPPKGSQ
ncbi:MAG: 16S rRNA (guanine(966)-N(2))-methyltransferase RsmD [Actinobacteria bacterium]|nr:16S rRNA (guanine(966)-N(2))-methyltransferase RsmD [Actinomycetota bacterium]